MKKEDTGCPNGLLEAFNEANREFRQAKAVLSPNLVSNDAELVFETKLVLDALKTRINDLKTALEGL